LQALKCLFDALKADKELVRLFQKISEIRVNRKVELLGNLKELEELKMTNTNRNDCASTYLNICAILSLMGNHEKALHMSQKAIEMITNQSISKYFTVEDYIDKLIGTESDSKISDDKKALLITLAASYYNKSVELDHLHNFNTSNKEYVIMASDSIECANQICRRLPKDDKLNLIEEIDKIYSKIQYKK